MRSHARAHIHTLTYTRAHTLDILTAGARNGPITGCMVYHLFNCVLVGGAAGCNRRELIGWLAGWLIVRELLLVYRVLLFQTPNNMAVCPVVIPNGSGNGSLVCFCSHSGRG